MHANTHCVGTGARREGDRHGQEMCGRLTFACSHLLWLQPPPPSRLPPPPPMPPLEDGPFVRRTMAAPPSRCCESGEKRRNAV